MSNSILLYVDIELSQHHLWQCPSPLNILGMMKINWHRHRLLFLESLFPWLICVSLFISIPHCLDYYSFVVDSWFKSCNASSFLLFLKITLIIWIFLLFHKIFIFFFVKRHYNFNTDKSNMIILINFSNPWTLNVFSIILIKNYFGFMNWMWEHAHAKHVLHHWIISSSCI